MKYQVEFQGVRQVPAIQIYDTKLEAKQAVDDFVAKLASEGFQAGVDYPVWSDWRAVNSQPLTWVKTGTITIYSGWHASIIVTELIDE